jgi:TIGR03009 family protein
MLAAQVRPNGERRNVAPQYDDRQYDDARDARPNDTRYQDGAARSTDGPAATDQRPRGAIQDRGGANGSPANAQTRPNANEQTKPVAPAPPFQVTPEQQRFVDELLSAWEKHSAGIKTFECDFTRWEYTPNFGPVGADGNLRATAISAGVMKYIKPDKGVFHVKETRLFNPKTSNYEKTADDVGEHWVCDGKVVWEVDAKLKQLRENPIPPEMQGTQIANGPLPFMLFGGEAAKLKARYFLREQTHPQFAKEEIWLETYPRWSGDAANYRSAHLIMKRADFLPYALRLYATNGADYTVFEFSKIKLNNVFMSDIKQPKVPSDWQIVKAQRPAQADRRPVGDERR